MKYRNLKKWDDVDNSYGLVFVAQLIDELLFEYTLDTYKPSAMNASLLVIEAMSTIKAIESGTIRRPNLKHILDELCENLDKDDVAKELLTVELKGVKAVLKDPKSNDSSVSTTVELLKNQLRLDVYIKKNQELLILEVCENQSPPALRTLTRSYITSLLNFGFSAKYIQKVSQRFFFYSKNRISGNEAIRDYLELFSAEAKEYNVIYRAPKYLSAFKLAGDHLGIKVTDSLEEFKVPLNRYNFGLRNNETYLLVPKTESKDLYFAKSISDRKIEQFQTLIGLYHHKEAPAPIIECLVIDSDQQQILKAMKSINPMHKCQDSKPGVASRKLAEFMEGFSMQPDSFNKFNRCAELHALALSSESIENQMINLWIALESLIPNKDSNNDISQIEHIAGSIIPFLNLGYINKIVTRLSKDLFQWDMRLTKKMLRNIHGDGIAYRLSNFLILEEFSDRRIELESSFKNFHLLEVRYNYVKYLLSEPANIINSLETHKTRVEWQIRRIYRVRNMIVHDGATPSYSEVLIENIHDYLDTVMSGIMVLASSQNTLDTIDQGFKMVEINYDSYYKSLNKKGLEFNQDNIYALLFSNPI
jgi:hypothetical protein